MVVPPFQPSAIDHTTVLSVRKPLTLMTGPIIRAEERDALHVVVSTVPIMFQAHNLQITVRTATQSSLGIIVRIIILQAINAKRTKLACSVRVSTW